MDLMIQNVLRRVLAGKQELPTEGQPAEVQPAQASAANAPEVTYIAYYTKPTQIPFARINEILQGPETNKIIQLLDDLKGSINPSGVPQGDYFLWDSLVHFGKDANGRPYVYYNKISNEGFRSVDADVYPKEMKSIVNKDTVEKEKALFNPDGFINLNNPTAKFVNKKIVSGEIPAIYRTGVIAGVEPQDLKSFQSEIYPNYRMWDGQKLVLPDRTAPNAAGSPVKPDGVPERYYVGGQKAYDALVKSVEGKLPKGSLDEPGAAVGKTETAKPGGRFVPVDEQSTEPVEGEEIHPGPTLKEAAIHRSARNVVLSFLEKQALINKTDPAKQKTQTQEENRANPGKSNVEFDTDLKSTVNLTKRRTDQKLDVQKTNDMVKKVDLEKKLDRARKNPPQNPEQARTIEEKLQKNINKIDEAIAKKDMTQMSRNPMMNTVKNRVDTVTRSVKHLQRPT